MTDHAFHQSVDILLQDDQPVWSLIVTLFGDLAQEKGAKISAALLTRIMGQLGIKPEATRVALHRLRKDGWISSEKSGRNSLYQLTGFGQSQSAEASMRIYGAPGEHPLTDWHILVSKPLTVSKRKELADVLAVQGYVGINGSVFLGQGTPKGDFECLVVRATGGDVPDWLRKDLFPKHLGTDFLDFEKRLQRWDSQFNGAFTPIQVVILRMLIVHNWRKLVLRCPQMPVQFIPDDWPEPRCRILVLGALTQLKAPALNALQ